MPNSQLPNDFNTPAALVVEAHKALKSRWAQGANYGLISGASFVFGALIATVLIFLVPVFASILTQDQYEMMVIILSLFGVFFITVGVVYSVLSKKAP